MTTNDKHTCGPECRPLTPPSSTTAFVPGVSDLVTAIGCGHQCLAADVCRLCGKCGPPSVEWKGCCECVALPIVYADDHPLRPGRTATAATPPADDLALSLIASLLRNQEAAINGLHARLASLESVQERSAAEHEKQGDELRRLARNVELLATRIEDDRRDA